MKSEILYPKAFRQKILFDDFSYGNIKPTDIDFCLDFNKNMIFCEIKAKGLTISTGQKILLQNLANIFSQSNERFLGIYAVHQFSNDEDVIAKDCYVKEFITDKTLEWRVPNTRISVYEMCNEFHKWVKSKRS
jgi:hypothetical protein